VKVDDTVARIKSNNSWLGSMSWIVTISPGMKKFFGYCLICYGENLQWPCLVTIHAMRVMSKKFGSIQKDIKLTFGAMKKSFKWVKNWNSLGEQANIDHVFTTWCCIIHSNIFLRHLGYLPVQYASFQEEAAS
jgi:hypothetical protein